MDVTKHVAIDVPRNVSNAIKAGVKIAAIIAFVTIVIKYVWSVLKRKV